jgi:hypothetical protein
MTDAQAILSIDLSSATKLFPGDKKAVNSHFRTLVSKWHPDHNTEPNARSVYEHVVKLRNIALDLLKGNAAPKAGSTLLNREYTTKDGAKSRFSYLRLHPGDLGDILIGTRTLTYEIGDDYEDVAEAEILRAGNLAYADDKMRNEMQRYLPTLKRSLKIGDKTVLFYDRPADCVLLEDLKTFLGGKVAPVHVAWIVSSLMNMVCYLNWAKLVHGAISLDTVLVCPAKHSIILVGGWGYATVAGDRPVLLPRRTMSLIPRLIVKGETVSTKVDIDLIKDIAQDLLGAPGGTGLHLDKSIPRPLIDWTLSPSSDDAIDEYGVWTNTLNAAFGKRKFVEMSVSPNSVYNL